MRYQFGIIFLTVTVIGCIIGYVVWKLDRDQVRQNEYRQQVKDAKDAFRSSDEIWKSWRDAQNKYDQADGKTKAEWEKERKQRELKEQEEKERKEREAKEEARRLALEVEAAKREMIFKAVKEKNIEALRLWSKDVDLENLTDSDGCGLLHIAAKAEANIDILKFLIVEKKLEVDKKNYKHLGWTPLHYAAHYNKDAANLSFLIDQGAYAKIKDMKGKTPIEVIEESSIESERKRHVLLPQKREPALPNTQGATDGPANDSPKESKTESLRKRYPTSTHRTFQSGGGIGNRPLQ